MSIVSTVGEKAKFLIATGVLAAVLGVTGCGGGSNNNQGASFTFLGWNAVNEDNECQLDTFIDAIVVPISDGVVEGADIGVFTCAVAQNNMCSQAVRVNRAILEYQIDGASKQPPTTTVAMGATFGAQQCDTTARPPGSAFPGGPKSSLPPGLQGSAEGEGGVAQQRGITVNTVPPQIREFLSTNRAYLPEPPFNMTITATLAGVTTSGQAFNSNPLSLNAVVTPDNLITAQDPTGDTAEEESLDDGIDDSVE